MVLCWLGCLAAGELAEVAGFPGICVLARMSSRTPAWGSAVKLAREMCVALNSAHVSEL